MKQLALKILRKAANYSGGAATGMALAAAAGGPAGAIGLAGLVGVIALCLVTEAVTEALEPDARLSRTETWLEELVRRHGRLDTAVQAIVDGRESNELISRESANALLTILVAPEAQLPSLVERDTSVSELLSSLAGRLTQLDHRALRALERQADLLGGIDASVRGVAERIDSLDQKLDHILIHQDKTLTEEEITATAVDEQDNCKLRIEALQKLFDQMEYGRARPFADRCEGWLVRAYDRLPAVAQARLLEKLLEEATVRARTLTVSDRPAAIERLRQLSRRLEGLLPQLEDPDRDRLSSHIAYVEAVVDRTEVGLSQLAGRSDPYAIRRRLAILADAERYCDATDLIRGAAPAVEWVEKAVVVATHCPDWTEAERLLQWALAHGAERVQQMCRLLFCEAVILSLPDDESAGRDQLSGDVRSRLERAMKLLRPMSDAVLALPEARHEFDYNVLRLAAELAVRLDDTTEVQRLVTKLACRRPFDLALGVLAVRGRVEPATDWPQRLRMEGEPSFDRRLVAAALEGRRDESRDAAFRAALRLAEEASTADQRKRLHGLLMELAQHLGETAAKELESVAPSLVGADDRQARLWSVTRMLRAGLADQADEVLEQLRDPADPLWLQMHGQRLLQKGDTASGVAELGQAARMLDQPEVLEAVAALALAHQQWGRAVELLERFLVLRPGEAGARASLAMALHRLEQYGRAATLLSELAQERPDNPAYAVNAAACLVKLGRPEEAAEELARACDQPDTPLQAVVGFAQLLVERDRPKEAFTIVNRHRHRFWSQYEFVGSYWSIAYAAEEEDAGHEAFVQMRRLQLEGSAPADIIVEKSLDDLVEMSKAHQERQRTIATAVLQGRMPWLLAAEWRRDPAYRAWAQRTNERSWAYEHPVNLSESAIYCTNGFTAVRVGSSRHLEPVESTGRGQPVVVDLSALITLQQLKLMQVAADYCGRLHVPEVYLFKMFWDNDHLRPHQPSRRTVLTVLRLALAESRIRVEATDGRDLRHVDEHYPQDSAPEGVYHLTDLADGLRTGGVATDEQLKRLSAVARRPATASANHEPLRVGDPVLIGVSTLSTLHSCGLLELVMAHFRVHLSAEDQRTVHGESAWFERQQRLRADNRELWDFLRDSPHVERHARRRGKTAESESEEEDDTDQDVSLEAMFLAEHLDLPLLADDRCVQTATLNARDGSASGSFSTVQLLESMARDGHISQEQHAAAIGILMAYRYRFIVPDPELLAFWARRAMTAPPGPDLQAIAAYLRACLRDPGLFGGLERTDPPSPIAMKFYQGVEAAIGEFIGMLWNDEAIPEERVQLFTQWSLAHLLPSPPAVMEPRIRVISDMGFPLFWSSLLMRLARMPRLGMLDRARRGVVVAGEALGMSEHAVIRVATEIIDGISSRST